MKILRAEFVTSEVGQGASTLRARDAEVAFVGRSNVGKSSLLNALMRQRLARTSAAAGKTRTANIYRVTVEGGPGGPGRWTTHFVDLPGYGYARGGGSAAAELAQVAESYFAQWQERRDRGDRSGLACLLVDARHPGLPADRQAFEWLHVATGGVQVVATKIDKLSRAERVRNLHLLEQAFGALPLPVSATTGEGLERMWQAIADTTRQHG
jgi:GTP-binding protein